MSKTLRLFADFFTSDKAEGVDNQPLYFCSVGMTRLELATSRPPDVCATNCATSRIRMQR